MSAVVQIGDIFTEDGFDNGPGIVVAQYKGLHGAYVEGHWWAWYFRSKAAMHGPFDGWTYDRPADNAELVEYLRLFREWEKVRKY